MQGVVLSRLKEWLCPAKPDLANSVIVYYNKFCNHIYTSTIPVYKSVARQLSLVKTLDNLFQSLLIKTKTNH